MCWLHLHLGLGLGFGLGLGLGLRLKLMLRVRVESIAFGFIWHLVGPVSLWAGNEMVDLQCEISPQLERFLSCCKKKKKCNCLFSCKATNSMTNFT